MEDDAHQMSIAKSYSSSRKKNLPRDSPADEEDDVFIPLEATVESLKGIVTGGGGGTTFVRAAVAAGKTTLARYLATKHSDEFFIVTVTANEQELEQSIIAAIYDGTPAGGTTKPSPPTLDLALKALSASKKTLILDECHIVFSFPTLSYGLFKAPQQWVGVKKPKILLFSAAAEGMGSDLHSIATPSQISKKYMWYPPMPDGATLSDILSEAEVYLDSESVDFFMKICSGHRGIFMMAMEWVQTIQQKQSIGTIWDIHESVSRVRTSLERSRDSWRHGIREYMVRSRAVHVNGKFSDIINIPTEFAEVVFGGPKSSIELGEHKRPLTIAGFLVPKRKNNSDEFVPYNWDVESSFGVANSLMAEYYGNIFASGLGYQREWTRRNPHSAADLVVRALPFMTFSTVIDNPLPSNDGEGSDAPMSQSETMLRSSLSSDGLPYEDHYNGALVAVLKDLGYSVSQPLKPGMGKTDLVVTYGGRKTCALEVIMATRSPNDHTEHAARFRDPNKPNYSSSTLKGLVIIGASKEVVLDRLRCTTGTTEKLEVIGLVVSPAHDAYEMYVRPCVLRDETRGPFFLVCDHVARGFETAEEGDRITAVNRLSIPKKRKGREHSSSSQGRLKSET